MSEVPDEAREALREAQALHGQGRIDDALAAVRRALAADPDYVDALTYYGTTLITRKLAYREGLQALERAGALAPADPGVAYSLGWCYEFAAYRLEKQSTRPLREAQGGLYRDPFELYELAAAQLQRCIDLEPEPGLAEDAQDLLDSIQQRLE